MPHPQQFQHPQQPRNPQYSQYPQYSQRELPPADSAGKSVLTFLLSLLSMLFISTFLFLAVIRPGNIENFIGNTDITWVLEQTAVGEQVFGALENFPAYQYVPIEADEIDEFLQRENVTGELANVLGGFVYAFIEGNLDHHVTPNEIVHIARNLEPEIEDHFGYRMTENDFQILETTLNNMDLEAFTIGRAIDETGMNIGLVSNAFSIYPLIILGVLSVMSLLTIFAVNGRNIPKALRAVGITILLPGLFYFPLGLILLSLPNLFSGVMYMAVRFMGGPATLMMQYGIICVIIGIALIISGAVVRRSARNREFTHNHTQTFRT